jgi:hypothetical protein
VVDKAIGLYVRTIGQEFRLELHALGDFKSIGDVEKYSNGLKSK